MIIDILAELLVLLPLVLPFLGRYLLSFINWAFFVSIRVKLLEKEVEELTREKMLLQNKVETLQAIISLYKVPHHNASDIS